MGLIPAHAGKTMTGSNRRCASTAHPRSRGENIFVALYENNETGSSPLTRGKPRGALPADGMERLIPAHAGKTSVRDV